MLEAAWYESSPVIYAVIGLTTVFQTEGLPVFFGCLLISISALVIMLRVNYRTDKVSASAKYRGQAGNKSAARRK